MDDGGFYLGDRNVLKYSDHSPDYCYQFSQNQCSFFYCELLKYQPGVSRKHVSVKVFFVDNREAQRGKCNERSLPYHVICENRMLR